MKITRVVLKPLKKVSKLNKFNTSNCVGCGFSDNVFIITFKVGDNSTEESLQDLAIDLSNVRLPKVYLSRPYTHNNAESDDYNNAETKFN